MAQGGAQRNHGIAFARTRVPERRAKPAASLPNWRMQSRYFSSGLNPVSMRDSDRNMW
jgi:hypothetical protein